MPQSFVVPLERDGERLDKALAALMRSSRASVQRWITEKRVLLNGRECRARDAVSTGDLIQVEPGPPPPSRAEPDASVSVAAVFEDDDLIVIEKPAGLVVHPGKGHLSGTLVNGLLARNGFGTPPADPLDPEGAMRPGIVHRIDKDTSGLIVVAKTVSAREGLKQQLAEHSVDRVYRAITDGVPPRTRLVTLHARHPHSRLKFTSRTQRGRQAITQVEPLEVLAGGAAAYVECRLETGRTHQIRVHLAEQLGHPLLGDALYGRTSANAGVELAQKELGRQALHAAVLGFVHPTSGERLRFESPLPADMQRALERLKRR